MAGEGDGRLKGLVSTPARKVGAAISAAALAAIGTGVVGWVKDRADDVTAGPALAVRVVPPGEFQSAHPYAPYYVVPSSVWADPQAVPAAERTADRLWGSLRTNGVPAAPGIVRVELRGRVDRPVVVNGIEVTVVGRKDPVAGWFVADPGCGAAPVRVAEVDLDRSPPRSVFVGEDGAPLRNLSLRVTRSDVEALEFHASTAADVEWTARIFYSGPDGRGSVEVDDDGRPFRVTGTKASQAYRQDHSGGQGAVALVREPAWDTGVQAC